jgi:hypothetical protein
VEIMHTKGGTMKRTILAIIIAACILLTVGGASAATFNLQDDKDDVIPCDKVDIVVTISGNTITIDPIILDNAYLTSNTCFNDIVFNQTDPTNVPIGITWIGFDTLSYGSPTDMIDGASVKGPSNYASFGQFSNGVDMVTANNDGKRTRGPITIYFQNPVNPVQNSNGITVATHINSVNTEEESVKFRDGECGGGGDLAIPEFPTIALPIVAILGLAFFFQRRKE